MAVLASTSLPLENLSIRTIDGDAAEDTSLLALANGRKLVVDFWTTRCERCPEAIAKLNDYAESRKVAGDDSTLFLTVCLDDEDFGRELVEEWSCTNLRHAFMAPDEKAAAKAAFGFSAVPYYVVALPHKGPAAPGDLCVEQPLSVVAHGGLKDLGKLVDLEAALNLTAHANTQENEGAALAAPIDVTSESAAEESAPAQPSFVLDEDF